MLIEERLAKIQKIVNEQKSISMEALAEQVSVSKYTIRRDLTRLEKEGHLKRRMVALSQCSLKQLFTIMLNE